MDMDFLPYFIMPLLGGLLIYWVIGVLIRMPGKELNKRFLKLGNFNGLTKDDFVRTVGPFQATSYHDGGHQLCQWYTAGYHISILFDAKGKFVKISNEIHS